MDSATVQYVADLSRIDLSADEMALFADQLSKILEYIEQLNDLDTDAVEPLAQAVEIPNVLRDDVVRQSLPPTRALDNAPEKSGDFYKVPQVLE